MAFALGLEIVVKLRNGGRTFQAGEGEQKRTDRKERFCSGYSKWSNLATWEYETAITWKTRKSVTGGQIEEERCLSESEWTQKAA